jgi:hypothetical protein
MAKKKAAAAKRAEMTATEAMIMAAAVGSAVTRIGANDPRRVAADAVKVTRAVLAEWAALKPE